MNSSSPERDDVRGAVARFVALWGASADPAVADLLQATGQVRRNLQHARQKQAAPAPQTAPAAEPTRAGFRPATPPPPPPPPPPAIEKAVAPEPPPTPPRREPMAGKQAVNKADAAETPAAPPRTKAKPRRREAVVATAPRPRLDASPTKARSIPIWSGAATRWIIALAPVLVLAIALGIWGGREASVQPQTLSIRFEKPLQQAAEITLLREEDEAMTTLDLDPGETEGSVALPDGQYEIYVDRRYSGVQVTLPRQQRVVLPPPAPRGGHPSSTR